MTLGEAITSIVGDFKSLATFANGPVGQYHKDKLMQSKSTTKAPRDFGDEASLIVDRVVALAKITHAQVEALKGGRFLVNGTRNHPVYASTREAILAEVGNPPEELAYLYRMHQSSVERIRRENNQDARTGEYVAPDERPLTQPARDTMKERAHV